MRQTLILTGRWKTSKKRSRDISAEMLEGIRQRKRGEIGRVVTVPAVAETRTQVGLSQSGFARLLGVSVRTLQEWEQGRRVPSGPARALLEEWQQMAGFLELLPSIDLPLIITHRDKPDFSMETKDHEIGIEVSWSCDQGWEEAERYLGSSKNDSVIARNWFINIRAKGKKLGRYLEGKQGDSPIWDSREMAIAWVKQIMDALLGKTGALNKEGFQKFEKNCLVMTDKLPFEFLDLDVALEELNSKTGGLENGLSYDEVYIVTQIRGERILLGRLGNIFGLIARKPFDRRAQRSDAK